MTDLFNKIKNLMLYAGLTKEEYDSIREPYMAPNRMILLLFSIATAIVTGAFAVISITWGEDLSGSRYFYAAACVVTSAIAVLNRLFGKKNPRVLGVLSAAFVFTAYLMGILNGTVGDPEHIAMTFIVLIVGLPLIFNGIPAVLLGEMTLACGVFIAMAFGFKPLEIAGTDAADAAAFGLISVVLNLYMASSKAKGVLSQVRAREAQLTAEKALEEARAANLRLTEQQEALDRAKREAETANSAKTAFLFNMSHDIRTPMNAILGYTDIAIRHESNPDRVRDSLKKIRASGGHLLNLINDILEMSRIESGRLELSEVPMDLRATIANVSQMSTSLAISKSISFNTVVGDFKDPYVLSDELHLDEVLINLISNAVKYTPDGGKVEFRAEEIEDARDGRAVYRFTVTDSGIGMSEEFQNHLFENFSREKTATVSKQEGSGLGLAIVKRIMDLANGSVRVKSVQGEGSVFTVELPMKVMDADAIREYREKIKKSDSALSDENLNGLRVLLVEDNEMNREIAQEILEDAGMLVDSAEDGEIAVSRVNEVGADYYDFILMDIQMPVMDGYEATRAIRKLPHGSRVPIIALSANAFKEDMDRSLEAGMNAHVPKPVNAKQLFTTMHMLAK